MAVDDEHTQSCIITIKNVGDVSLRIPVSVRVPGAFVVGGNPQLSYESHKIAIVAANAAVDVSLENPSIIDPSDPDKTFELAKKLWFMYKLAYT